MVSRVKTSAAAAAANPIKHSSADGGPTRVPATSAGRRGGARRRAARGPVPPGGAARYGPARLLRLRAVAGGAETRRPTAGSGPGTRVAGDLNGAETPRFPRALAGVQGRVGNAVPDRVA